MDYYELRDGVSRKEKCEDIAFDIQYDLLVAGLGSAGTYLAMSAAREGVSVLGIERGNCCGGMSVQGSVNGHYNGCPGGSYEKDDSDVADKVGRVYTPYYNHPDAKKLRLEKRLREYGVKIEYRSVILGVYAQNDEIKGAKLLIDGKKVNCGCKFLSDSTSDGHILRILGINGSYGRDFDGAAAPFSSVKVLRRGDFITRTNHDSGYINPYDDKAFSEACIRAHGQHFGDKEQENDRFLYIAPLIGNREGMTFEGEQTLTLADILEEKVWENELFCAFSDIDKHGFDRAFESELFKEWFVVSNLSTVTFKIRVPLGVIIPKGKRGLISVSRCISTDTYASSAVRMNIDMYRLGEASGVAVAMAVKNGGNSLLDISASELKSRVIELGCFDGYPDRKKGFVERFPVRKYIEIQWLNNFEDIKEALSGDCPGIAIWSCRIMGEKCRERLMEFTQSENINLRYNSAIALGLLRDEQSIPILREIVKNRCEYHYLDCRRSNQLRSVIAIYLLGRFGDMGIIDELSDILKPEEYSEKMYHTYKEPDYKLSIVEGLNSVYYQHFSFSCEALLDIAKMHPEKRDAINKILSDAVKDKSYIARITSHQEGIYFKLAEDIIKRIKNRT